MRRTLWRYAPIALGATLCLLALASNPPVTSKKPKATVDFNRDVRPILAQHCWVCHGADKAALEKTGNMKLDTFEGATKDRGGYRAIVPGDPLKSKLMERIQPKDPEMQMPPPGSGVKPLTPQEVATLHTWIKEGAEYRQHWAFVPPKMPALPVVSDTKWCRNDIDRFILAKLEEEHLKPEPEADKRTLIRRASLTLTGLPPTPGEVDTFLADKRSDAYERLVDRLLASPRFGENQARYWLDAVRYADTHGLHIDNERAIFPYRDWVVRAYNEDLPFDKFALWQLAGDLLPNPTTEQKIATGYIRLNPTTNEGGAIEAEFLAKNTMDRVDTTATVFMGVTLQCAKCHDHKYDPFSQRDYYSMYAFFDSTADSPLDGNLKLHEPVMKAPTPEQDLRLRLLDKQMDALANGVSIERAKMWAKKAAETLPVAGLWEVSQAFPQKSFDLAFSTEAGDSTATVGTSNLQWKPIDIKLEQPSATVVGKENAFAYLRTTVYVDKPTNADLRLGSDDAIKVWSNGTLVHSNKVLRSLSANADRVTLHLNAGANKLLIKIVNAGSGDGVFVGLGNADDQKIHDYALSPPLSGDQQRDLARTYLLQGDTTASGDKYRQCDVERRILDAQLPYTYIAKELPMPRKTFLLRRGQYDLQGDEVQRSIPGCFGTLPKSAPQNRLGLAQWIASPSNPLTARVAVNRIWQQHFGQGLVKSSEDFGSRGDWPTNPELLDYLACRFAKDGWSIKKLTRLIVTSAAFRQSATGTSAKRQKDPDNALISRGPRFRLDAEVIRDCALYDAGLLYEKPGGHSDKPYQPAGLWEIIAYPISDTARYMQDHGSALYRRSLYMFWKRTSPPPTMMLFDAPMRESCVVRRSRTNTPTQALATLNETGFFEDARAMAQRVMRSKAGDANRLDYAFRLATSRPATKQELDLVTSYLSEQRNRYRTHPDEAEKTLSIGESPRDKSLPAPEHAAWTLVCNLILNLDEALTQH